MKHVALAPQHRWYKGKKASKVMIQCLSNTMELQLLWTFSCSYLISTVSVVAGTDVTDILNEMLLQM